MTNKSDILATRWSLVEGIKNPEDQERWAEFYEFYRDVIVGVARKAGLREAEAEDVLQETMRAVAKNIGGFEVDPERGSFRGWLLQMVRWRIEDQRKKRLPVQPSLGSGSEQTNVTSTVERVPDLNAVDLEGVCDAEWKSALLKEGLRRLRLKVKADQFQIFYLLEVEQKPVAQVAAMVNRNAAQVYLIKHRVSAALKKIMTRLKDDFETGKS